MDQIQVVSRNAIPPIRAVHQGGELHDLGELRDFRWHDQLRNFMPAPSRFSVSWVRLEHGEVLEPHVHPIQSMMVFYAGSGQILGDLRGPIAKDDVVVMPAGCEHGFVGGPDGLCALSIQFGEGLYTAPEKPRVLFTNPEHSRTGLVRYNQGRLEAFKTRPMFELLRDGTLESPEKRDAFLGALRIWTDGYQALLFSRQASCLEPAYHRAFLQHMQEKLAQHKQDHSETPATADAPRKRDPIMQAITNWFVYQMYVLDNAEKHALMHLVVECANRACYRAAMPVFTKSMSYQRLQATVDTEYERLGEELLDNESPATYARLRHVVGEAWDMIGAMTDRIVELTRRG